jgi:hypothetical protein
MFSRALLGLFPVFVQTWKHSNRLAACRHFEGEASFDTSTTMAKTADGDTGVIATTTVVV